MKNLKFIANLIVFGALAGFISGCSFSNVFDDTKSPPIHKQDPKQTQPQQQPEQPVTPPAEDKSQISRNAIEILAPKCELGDMKACNDVGANYEFLGEHKRAFEYYNRSCDGAVERACANLGVLYEQGLGVMKNPQKALEIYTASCNNSGELSCYHLANAYRRGDIVPQDYNAAMSAYTNACELGDIPSCANIGSMYELALGVKKDEKRAHSIYKVACYRGLEKACVHMKRLGEKLGIAQ